MLGDLRRAAAEVKARHPDIRRVLLFGSFARGDWTADSDADLVIVASREFRTVSERAPYQIFVDSVPTDTLVYSEREFEELTRDPSGFVATELASAVDLSL